MYLFIIYKCVPVSYRQQKCSKNYIFPLLLLKKDENQCINDSVVGEVVTMKAAI